MTRKLLLLARSLAHFALAAWAVWLVLEGARAYTGRVTPVLVRQDVEQLEPYEGEGHFARASTLKLERRDELDALALVPDPRAGAHALSPTSELRVLAPEALVLRRSRAPRAGRPLLFDVALQQAPAEDRLWLEREGAAPRALELQTGEDGAHASFELPPLAAGTTRFALRWSGAREGRQGELRHHYALDALPPPRVLVGAGVRRDGPFATALRAQGFELEPESAAGASPPELALRSLASAPDAELLAEVDRGLGLLLVASETEPVHPGLLALLPVVPLPTDTPGPQQPGGTGEGSVAGGDSTENQGDSAHGQGDPDRMQEGVRRAGAPSRAEEERAEQDRQERDVRAAAVVFVLDVSGTMSQGRPSRIELAKRALLASALQLGEGDEFAVVAFGSTAEVVVRMGRADRKEQLRGALERLAAEASATWGYPALRSAHEQLKQATGRSPVRHVVLITDGELQDQFRYDYRGLMQQMRREGISVSAIGISSDDALIQDPFEFLEREIVRPSGGRFAEARSATELPRLLLGEIRLVRGGKALDEGRSAAQPEERPAETAEAGPEAETPPPPEEPRRAAETPAAAPELELFVVQSEPVLRGLEEHEWPPLRGALPLEAQLRARVHLGIGEAGRVALAAAPFGLGRVAVFAGSDGGPWSADFVRDARFPQLAGQLASWLQREGQDAAALVPPHDVEVLAGTGREEGVLEEAARRLGARIVPELPTRADDLERRRTEAPWRELLLLAGGFLLLLGLERLLARIW